MSPRAVFSARRVLFVALLLLATTGAAVAQDPTRTVEQDFLPGGASTIHLDLSFGEILVEGSRGKQVEATLELYCNRADEAKCRKRAERVRLVAKTNGSRFTIKTKGTPRGRARGIRARMVVRVPDELLLDVNNRAGAVTVRGMKADVEIDAPAGDVEVVYPQKRVRSVKLDIGVGSIRLHLKDGSQVKGRGFPRSVRWTGNGDAAINVDVGTGDITVKLE